MTNLKAKLSSLLQLGRRPPIVTENSTLEEIGGFYKKVWELLEQKYHLKKSQLDPKWSLLTLSQKFDLPPAQIIFMEIQLAEQSSRVEQITALEAQKILDNEKKVLVLDVREPWEREFGSLPKSKVLDKTLMKQIKKNEAKDTPIILYCHFGVRSLDAAHHLMQEGFLRIYTIKGGIDAWAAQVDPSLQRYSGSYC